MFLFRKKMFYLGQKRYQLCQSERKGGDIDVKGEWCVKTSKWKRHQHRGVKATNRRRGSQINLAHLKQYGHGVLAISRLLPGESEAGNLSGIRLRCHHWQTMGSWYLRYNQFKSLKRKTDSILFFFFSDSDNIRDRVLPFSRGLEIERTGRNPC